MKKKVISMMLVGTMVISALLTGCGDKTESAGSQPAEKTETTQASEAKEEAPAEEKAPSGEEQVLTVFAWDPNFNIPALRDAEKAYQQKNPDFKLDIIEQGGSGDVKQAITLAGSSGDYSTLPDITFCPDRAIRKFVEDYPDIFIPVNNDNINWDGFMATKLAYGEFDGVHYGIPADNGTVVFAYRTDILEECGYTLDDVTGITWDRFDEIGKEVYAKTGKYLLSMDGKGNDLPYIMLQAEGVSQFKDGKPYITENEKLVEIVNVIVKLAQDNVLYIGNDWTEYTNQTIIGDMVAGVMNGNWIIPTIELVEENSGKWGITSIPTLSGEEGYAANGGGGLYITANCKNVDLANDFLAYTFGGGDGAIETYSGALKDGGFITSYIPASEADAYKEGVAYFNDQPIYETITAMSAKVPVVEENDNHYTCREYMSTAIQNILNGTDTAAALKDAEDQLNFAMGN